MIVKYWKQNKPIVVNRRVYKLETNFLHPGAHGDIIYSLPAVIAFGGGSFYFKNKGNFHTLHSLVSSQPYISSVNMYTKADKHKIDVDFQAAAAEDVNKKHLCECFLDPFNKTYDLSKPWLFGV